MYKIMNLTHPEVTPVIYLDTAGDEDYAGAGGRPDGERDGQQNQQQLLQSRNISTDPARPTGLFTSMISTSWRVTTNSVLLAMK